MENAKRKVFEKYENQGTTGINPPGMSMPPTPMSARSGSISARSGMIMSPPLTFGRDDIDKAVGIAKMSLDMTAADLGIK